MEGATGRKSMRGRPRGEPTAVVRLPLPLASLARRLREGTLRAGDIGWFLAVEPGEHRTIRFVEGTAACGFPSPADDYLEHPLDFNELLIRMPVAPLPDTPPSAGQIPCSPTSKTASWLRTAVAAKHLPRYLGAFA